MSNEELRRYRCDVQLDGIRWDGDDVIFTLSRNSPKDALDPPVQMRCVWTSDLVIGLDMTAWKGTALTWDVEYKSLPHDRWSIVMDFAQHGTIRLECDAIEIDGRRVAEPPRL
jgi:hypothetical protein